MCHVDDSKALTNDINSVDIRDLEEIGKYSIEKFILRNTVKLFLINI